MATGIASCAAPLYIESAPPAIRGLLISINQMAITGIPIAW
jgi:hypothetical protein